MRLHLRWWLVELNKLLVLKIHWLSLNDVFTIEILLFVKSISTSLPLHGRFLVSRVLHLDQELLRLVDSMDTSLTVTLRGQVVMLAPNRALTLKEFIEFIFSVVIGN